MLYGFLGQIFEEFPDLVVTGLDLEAPRVIWRRIGLKASLGDPERRSGLWKGLGRLPQNLKLKGLFAFEKEEFFIEALFHADRAGSLFGLKSFYKIKVSFMANGAVFTQWMAGLHTQDSLQVDPGRKRTVKIDGAFGLFLESPVVSGKVTNEKTIGLFFGLDPVKTHFFDKPVLEGPKESFDSSLGLRGIGMNDLDPEFVKGPLKLALRAFSAQEFVLHARFAIGFVGRVFIQIDRERKAVAGRVAREAVHRRQGPFVIIKAGEDRIRRIVNVTHQDKPWASSFQPVMMGSIHLDHFPKRSLPFSPCPAGMRFFLPLIKPLFQKPKPQGLAADCDSLPLPEFFLGKRGTKAKVVHFVGSQDFDFETIGIPPIRNPSPKPVRDSPLALASNPFCEALDLTDRKIEKQGSLALSDCPFEGFLNDAEPFPFFYRHRNDLLFSHPSLPACSEAGLLRLRV